ncbi:RNA-directed DNA polymerase from transposon BS, partial [Paramuricea clavata]
EFIHEETRSLAKETGHVFGLSRSTIIRTKLIQGDFFHKFSKESTYSFCALTTAVLWFSTRIINGIFIILSAADSSNRPLCGDGPTTLESGGDNYGSKSWLSEQNSAIVRTILYGLNYPRSQRVLFARATSIYPLIRQHFRQKSLTNREKSRTSLHEEKHISSTRKKVQSATQPKRRHFETGLNMSPLEFGIVRFGIVRVSDLFQNNCFVYKTTYYLDGDGPLVFSCYERLSALVHAIAIESYPNTEAKAREHAAGNMPLYSQLVAQAKACIFPGFMFYQHKFSVEFHNIVRAFKAARLCCPVKVQELHPTAASVQELKQFGFFTDVAIVQLVEELPKYLAIADGLVIETEEGKVKWWSDQEITLPCWSTAVKKILLVQPSSAPAERVFSLLQNAFNKQQDAALEELSSNYTILSPLFYQKAFEIYKILQNMKSRMKYICKKSSNQEMFAISLSSCIRYIMRSVRMTIHRNFVENYSPTDGSICFQISWSINAFMADERPLLGSYNKVSMSISNVPKSLLVVFETFIRRVFIIHIIFNFIKTHKGICQDMMRYKMIVDKLTETFLMEFPTK